MEVELVAKTEPISGGSDMSVVEQAACICYNSEPTDDFKVAKDCYAYGHCYDEETEVLTQRGFVKWPDVNENDLIGAVDPDSGEFLGFEKPIAIIQKHFDGDMVRIKHRSASLYVTDGHKLYVSISKTAKQRVNPKYQLVEANKMLKTGKMVYESPIRLKTYATNKNNKVEDGDIIYSLFGFFIGDGYAEPDCTDRSQKIRFHLRKDRKIKFLKHICGELGFNVNDLKNDKYVVDLKGYTQKWFRNSFYNKKTGGKTFPDKFYKMSANQFCYFVDGLIESDGYYYGIHMSTQYMTTSKELADKLQTLCSINGRTASIRSKQFEKYTLYNIYIFRNNRVSLPMVNDSRNKKAYAKKEHFSGTVYCAQVSSGLLMVRRDGCVCLCGNCSVLEHISFTFKVTGVSRALLAQLSRHRHISLSVASQRYICYQDGFDYVNPFMEETVGHDFFESDMKELQDHYNRYIAIGEKAENARAVLPNACCTELFLTMNARALIEASNKRLCSRAQDEIREMFQKMKQQVSIHSPIIASWMVPSCEKNKKYPFCPEHKSCGRHPKLESVYQIGRCKNCKNASKHGDNILTCEIFERDLMPDDFCSQFEPK